MDVGALAQEAAEVRLAAIGEAEALLDDGIDVVDYPASAPWDGCEQCIVREVLDAAWPVIVGNFAGFLEANGHPRAAAILLEEYQLP